MALMVLGGLVSLACVSAIGAITALTVMALDKPAPAAPAMFAEGEIIPGLSQTQEVVVRPMLAPQSSGCVVAAWKTGLIYCLRNKSGEGNKPVRDGPAVTVQAQADPAQ